MKKISKLLVVLFMLVLSMNFVMADIVAPGDRPVPVRPDAPKSTNAISPTAIIVIGVVLAVFGLNKLKNDEMNNNMQPSFGSAPKPEAEPVQAPVEETEEVEKEEDEADEEIK